MQRNIILTLNVIVLLLLIIYCAYYVLGDCIECFSPKINHPFIALVAMILSAFASFCILLLNPPKKKKPAISSPHYITKNKKRQLKNKTNLFLSIAVIAVLSFAVSSCKKDNKNKCTRGAGGSTTVVAFPKHHGADTKPSWAFVKYNTTRFAGIDSADYDLKIAGNATENYIKIENVKCGDYYIYMVAFDTIVNHAVSGGTSFSTEADSGVVNVNVPVTE